MDYIVRVWREKEPIRFYEYSVLKDAKEFADFAAERCEQQGVEYDVAIYEITNY